MDIAEQMRVGTPSRRHVKPDSIVAAAGSPALLMRIVIVDPQGIPIQACKESMPAGA